eukprot:TRINITY_DN8604_c0_g1_i21.p1 TRINITY_DN8604_c0_g1~~TRINITY_DN8604_c0_g1_i21.p1  ORF type:complete len:372 (-),score=48.80 TRINITY_DN8604_c0_g1_i21:1430-2545(-)
MEYHVSTLSPGNFENTYWESMSNILVLVPPSPIYGLGNKEDASNSFVLLSAHYDTVAMSVGASDSSGVAVMLEVLRAITAHKFGPRLGLMVLINNGKELGLLGSKAFVNEQLSDQHIRAFVNLDSTLHKPMIFETTGGWIDKLVLHTPRPYATVIASDILSSGIVQFATDFKTYNSSTSNNGLDFAFFQRKMYHTMKDSNLSDGSMQFYGDNVLALVQYLMNFTNSPPQGEWKNVYFDLLNYSFVCYSIGASFVLHVIFTCLILLGLLFTLYGLSKWRTEYKRRYFDGVHQDRSLILINLPFLGFPHPLLHLFFELCTAFMCSGSFNRLQSSHRSDVEFLLPLILLHVTCFGPPYFCISFIGRLLSDVLHF